MEKWNCKQRAFQWARDSSMLKRILQCDPPGWQAMWRARFTTAVAKLMREAHQHGFEKGYTEGRKAAEKSVLKAF